MDANSILLIFIGAVIGWPIGILLGTSLIVLFLSIKDKIESRRYRSASADPLGDYIAALMR